MKKIVNIVVDASGSMVEDGKNAVVKYLLNGIISASKKNEFKDLEFELFQWGKETKKIDNIEKAKINFAGKSDIKGLVILENLLNVNKPILLISDGNFDSDEKEKIKCFAKKIITIFVGVDANKSILQNISTDTTVFSVEDLFQALRELQD